MTFEEWLNDESLKTLGSGFENETVKSVNKVLLRIAKTAWEAGQEVGFEEGQRNLLEAGYTLPGY